MRTSQAGTLSFDSAEKAEAESHTHLFCRYSRWIITNLLQDCGFALDANSLNLPAIINSLSPYIKGKSLLFSLIRIIVASAVWHIWAERNSRLHGRTHTTKEAIRSKIANQASLKAALLDIKEDAKPEIIAVLNRWRLSIKAKKGTPIILKWQPAAHGSYSLHTDASISQLGSGIGFIIRDAQGDYVSLGGLSTTGTDITLLELMAIREGLIRARQLGITEICIHSDSQVAIHQIKTSDMERNLNYQMVVNEIFFLRECYRHCCFTHIYRELNQVADAIAKMASEGIQGAIQPIPRGLLK